MKPGPASSKFARKAKKLNEEPVVLTLSSDEEDNTTAKVSVCVIFIQFIVLYNEKLIIIDGFKGKEKE